MLPSGCGDRYRTPGAGGIGPSASLARCFRPGVVIATELRQRRPKPSTFRTLTPRFDGSGVVRINRLDHNNLN